MLKPRALDKRLGEQEKQKRRDKAELARKDEKLKNKLKAGREKDCKS